MKTNGSALIVPPRHASSGTNDIRGIKAPVEIPNAWGWLYGLAAILILSLASWYLWKRFRKRKAEPETKAPEIPAHERALERLREALALIQQPRPFCIAVSDTIRLYLEERFRLRAPERTTEEFLDELQSSALLSLEQKQALQDFLTQCDLVKFAKYEPREPELRRIYDAGVRLIEETYFVSPAPPLLPPNAAQSNA